MTFLQIWWKQPDQYELLKAYIEARRQQRIFQYFVAFITATLATMPIATLFTPTAPHSAAGHVLAVAVATLAFAMACLWMVRFPNRRQFLSFVAASVLAIAIACTLDGNAFAGLLGATAFAMLGGYVAIMHSARVMAFCLVVATTTTGTLAARATEQYGLTLAASRFVLVMIGILAMPVAVQALVQHLGIDAIDAGIDPLTQLLNRRAFERMSTELAHRTSNGKTPHHNLCVIMIDLDQFKTLNDTFGHTIGDQVLVGVSDLLRRYSPTDSVIGRMGGEEFLIAVAIRPTEAESLAEAIRAQIAGLRHKVTASVGVATADPSAPELAPIVPRLAQTADYAMYEAKRKGGNQVVCCNDSRQQ